jgi:hypothetical protein
MLDSLALQRVLIDGSLLSLVLGVIVLGSLMYNARLWLQDYPKPIREKVPPLSAAEKRERAVLAVLVMGILFGGVILEARQAGTISFGAAYLRILIMLVMFNVFDAVVLDLFIITLLKPRFVIIPGMEGMEYLLYDYRKQATDFLKGMIFSAVASLPFAVIAVL